MTWWLILVTVGLPLFLLASGSRSTRRTVDFYRSYYSRTDLETLADGGSDFARRALER